MKLWNCRYSEVRLGGTIAARANRAGVPVRLAARTTDSAEALRRSGLRVSGFGGEVRAEPIEIDVSVLEGGDSPGQIASSGVPILYVPLRSRVAVDAATIERGKLRALLRSVNLDELPAFVFARQQADDDATVHSRMFRACIGSPEDPATGAASKPLGAYLLQHTAVSVDNASRLVNRISPK